MRSAIAFEFLAILLLAACDPTYGVTGTIAETSGDPIAGATVTMTCPSGRTEVAVTTADGAFGFGGVSGSFEAPQCFLRVEKPTFVARDVRTTDACYRGTQAHNVGVPCKAGEGKIVLTR